MQLRLSHLRAGTLALAAAAALPAQNLLHYKFDDRCNDRAINYAAGSPAPAEGTVLSTLTGAPTASWTSGKFAGALAGGVLSPTPAMHNHVDTGWNPGTVSGDLTWACWLKMDPAAPTPGLTYVFGNGSNFRVFTGGGGFFLTSGWGGNNVNTAAHIQNLARAGWIHLALVLDGSTLTGTYYVNGVPEPAVSLTSAVQWSGTAFYVGKHSSLTTANIFDLDEFLLTNRAMSRAEVATLASSPRGGDANYGSGGCGGLRLTSTGGPPSLGNTAYALLLDGGFASSFALNIGSNRCRLGALTLPFDLGAVLPQLAGCLLEAADDVGTFSGTKPPGPLTIPLPIPNIPSLSGANLFLQAPGLDLQTSSFVVSNSLSIGLGL